MGLSVTEVYSRGVGEKILRKGGGRVDCVENKELRKSFINSPCQLHCPGHTHDPYDSTYYVSSTRVLESELSFCQSTSVTLDMSLTTSTCHFL